MAQQIDYGRVTGKSAYEQAVDGGYSGTEEQYEALLASYADTALKAEGYAVGKQNGTDVTSESPYYHNNSKYYKEQAATSATAAETAAASATAAYGTTLLAPTYSTSGTYAVGDYCIYSGNMYRCTTAITTGESWTSGHWTQVAVGSETSALKSAIDYIGESLDCSRYYLNASMNSGGEITDLIPGSTDRLVVFSVKPNYSVSASGIFSVHAFYENKPEIGSVSYNSSRGGSSISNVIVPVNCYWLAIRGTDNNIGGVTITPKSSVFTDIDLLKLNDSTIESNVDDLTDAVYNIVEPSSNKYNNSLVTSTSITTNKRLISSGAEESNSNFAISPYMPIKPNQQYTIALVPVYGSATVPSYGTSVVACFYDESNNFCGFTETATFRTPINATKYRLNLSMSSVGLSVINNRTMIVEGSTTPTEYVPYSAGSKTSKIIDVQNEVDELKDQIGQLVKHHLSGTIESGIVLIRNGTTIYSGSNFLHATYTNISNHAGETVYVTGKSNTVGDDGKAYVLYGFYDSNGNLLVSHESAVNTGYTNVSVSVPANATKLIVNGVIDPANYSPSVIGFNKSNTTNIIAYEKYSGTLYVSKLYKNGTIDIEFGKRGPNQLPDFKKITAEGRKKYNGSSDMHSPFTIRAVNNIDGDDVEHHTYTGGNHNYGDTGTTDYSATARNISFDIYADGKLLSDGDYGLATIIKIDWVNRAQGYNTKKADGSGREIIEERHTIVFDGVNWVSTVELEPLEDVVIENYYGYQCPVFNYPNIHMIGATYKKEFAYTSPHDSGNNTPNVYVACSTDDRLEMEVDRSYDMGKGTYYSGAQGFRTIASGKGYTFLIANLSAASGDIFGARGIYRFIPNY